MKRIVQEREEITAIDLSPLIDMTFILLIFFMVTTVFVKDMQLDINRPGAASSRPANTKSIRVFIDRHQQIFVDGQQVQPWILQNKLRDMTTQKNAASVLVVTDKEVSADKLIEVVDQCRLAGIKDVAVATEKEMGPLNEG